MKRSIRVGEITTADHNGRTIAIRVVGMSKQGIVVERLTTGDRLTGEFRHSRTKLKLR